MSNVDSISSSNSKGSFPTRSSLLINVKIGIPLILHTLKSLSVCGSIPFAQSITITALSTAINVRYVSSEKSSCPGVSNILTLIPSYSNCITELVTDIPLCCSISIQSLVANFPVFFPLTVPASLIAPPNNNNFSVKVVLPASGWDIIANVFLLFTCFVKSIICSSHFYYPLVNS